MNILRRIASKLKRDIKNDVSLIVKNSDVKFNIDNFVADNGKIIISGWIFSDKIKDLKPKLCFRNSNQNKIFELEVFERQDVYDVFKTENALLSGFSFTGKFITDCNIDVYITVEDENFGERLIRTISGANSQGQFRVTSIDNKNAHLDSIEKECIEEYVYGDYSDKWVDIIIPVYNGFDFLENLFKTVEHTKVNHRIFVVNDCSPDERVLPFLKEQAKKNTQVVLIENTENLGFVQSVNKALLSTAYDVVILNTDVELPHGWIERVMAPIWNDSTVASATPYTNSGTICSFPNFCDNNEIFMGLSVEEVDKEFSKIKPRYSIMPTGVGFCMAMSRKSLDDIGLLDAETFYKGYGEENDWCQRAINAGYKNVMVENLFVYHKHGASFASEDKKRYIERNSKLLLERYPNYDRDVQFYVLEDENKDIREFVKYRLMAENCKECTLIFDHNWGGGANSYNQQRVSQMLEDGQCVITVVCSKDKYSAEVCCGNYKASVSFEDRASVFNHLREWNIKHIIINELISFDELFETMDDIVALKKEKNADMEMLAHDFYSICPSCYLMNDKSKHCFMPTMEECVSCIGNNKNSFNKKYNDIVLWRNNWNTFLNNCEKIVVFSNNSKEYFNHWYKNLDNIEVKPHSVNYMEKIQLPEKKSKTVTIGFLGNFMYIKGAEILLEMQKIIEKKGLDAKIVVIGSNAEGYDAGNIKFTGRYEIQDVQKLIIQNDVDIIFIASICPETFSYTTEEVIKMGMNVASFDIGAPQERIRNYEKGLVISEMTAETALREIMDFVSNNR